MTTRDVRGCLEAALAGTRRRLRRAGVHLEDWGLTERPREWTLWLECRGDGWPGAAQGLGPLGSRRCEAPVRRAAASWPRTTRAGRRQALAALAQALSEVALMSGRGATMWSGEREAPNQPRPAPPRRARAPSGRCG
jgi:hypothetical protein